MSFSALTTDPMNPALLSTRRVVSIFGEKNDPWT